MSSIQVTGVRHSTIPERIGGGASVLGGILMTGSAALGIIFLPQILSLLSTAQPMLAPLIAGTLLGVPGWALMFGAVIFVGIVLLVSGVYLFANKKSSTKLLEQITNLKNAVCQDPDMFAQLDQKVQNNVLSLMEMSEETLAFFEKCEEEITLPDQLLANKPFAIAIAVRRPEYVEQLLNADWDEKDYIQLREAIGKKSPSFLDGIRNVAYTIGREVGKEALKASIKMGVKILLETLV